MDLKGKNWVGNIYQKFEAMCQEVDDFVSKDTVKYFENQVQTVGESVKFFCSDVAQDLLHSPLADSLKHEAESVPHKLNDAIGTYTKSMINIEEKHVDVDTKQLSVEQVPIDPLENCHTSPFTGLNPVKQIMPLPTEDFNKLAYSVLSSGQEDDDLVYENMDMNLEGNTGSEVEGIVIKEQSLSEDLSSPENKTEALSLSESVEGVEEYHNLEILAKVSSPTLVDGAGIRSSPKERTICDYCFNDCHSNISSTPRSSELAFSFVSFGSKVSETTLISSSSSLSTESCHLSEFSHAIPQATEKIGYDCTDAVTCVSDLSVALSSSKSFPNTDCDNNADKSLSFSNSVLSLESTDVGSSRTDDTVSVDGSSGNKLELHCKCSLLENFMSSLEIDPSMETVDLSDKVKLDESCVIVDSKLISAVSCRARKHRSYKKIIQDAFASRKRLTKEYEQLAIWYGDIDMESVQHAKQNMLPSITEMSVETKHSPIKDLCDSEWELL